MLLSSNSLYKESDTSTYSVPLFFNMVSLLDISRGLGGLPIKQVFFVRPKVYYNLSANNRSFGGALKHGIL